MSLLHVAEPLPVSLPSQRRPPARPSFACSRGFASSSGTLWPIRALWRSRPLKSYQVQTLSLSHWSCPKGEVTLTCIESFLMKHFSRGTFVSMSPPTGVLWVILWQFVRLTSCMRCPSLLHLKSKTEVQLKLTNRVSMSNRLSETQPRSRTSMFEQTVVKVSCLKLSIRILIQPIENFGHIKLTFASALPLTLTFPRRGLLIWQWRPFLSSLPEDFIPLYLKKGRLKILPLAFTFKVILSLFLFSQRQLWEMIWYSSCIQITL